MTDPGRADVPPAYGAGSLADVLPSVLTALGAPHVADTPADPLGLGGPLADVRVVVVLLVDGLGWHQLPLLAQAAPTLTTLVDGRPTGELTGCRAATITAGFPSTTPTSLVSFGTGAAPGRHGVVGFTVNVPGSSRVLVHIHWWGDPDPMTWQPLTTQFDRAVAADINAIAVGRPEFATSGLTRAAYRGGRYVGASDGDEFVASVQAAMQPEPTARVLVFGYLAELDTAGHAFGVGSPEWYQAATSVDGVLARIITALPPGTAVVVTADHGQLNVSPEHRFDIGTDPRLQAGVSVIAGEPRVRYLHVQPGALPDVRAAWREVLAGAASVLDRDQAIAQGWFGPVPAIHLPRIGDLVVICHGDYAILSTGTEPATTASLIALHGSATEIEMRIPLLVAVR